MVKLVIRNFKSMDLHQVPIGLFSCNGEICFKSEYRNDGGNPIAYIVSSGEAFHGKDRNLLAIEIEDDYVDVEC